MIYENVVDLIGRTPLVKINKLNPNLNVTILAKLERFNPGGSVKDRIAKSMIEAIEKEVDLKDKVLLEATSGNTGIGLAMVAAAKGYKLLLTMSEGVSLERRKILRAYGADILLTPADKGTDGAIEKAYALAKFDSKYVLIDQFNNENNWRAHYNTTAEEILSDAPNITHFVASMGTTGTLMGVGKKLRETKPDVKIIGAEPVFGHKLQGLKNLNEAYVPTIFDRSVLTEKVYVEDNPALEVARALAKKEGIFVGMSSGAAMKVALDKAKTLDSGVIVVIFPDSGEKYLSTNLFEEKEVLLKRSAC